MIVLVGNYNLSLLSHGAELFQSFVLRSESYHACVYVSPRIMNFRCASVLTSNFSSVSSYILALPTYFPVYLGELLTGLVHIWRCIVPNSLVLVNKSTTLGLNSQNLTSTFWSVIIFYPLLLSKSSPLPAHSDARSGGHSDHKFWEPSLGRHSIQCHTKTCCWLSPQLYLRNPVYLTTSCMRDINLILQETREAGARSRSVPVLGGYAFTSPIHGIHRIVHRCSVIIMQVRCFAGPI